MVWSTTQSALYNDLSRYYEDDKRPRKKGEKIDSLKEEFNEVIGEKCRNKCNEKLPEKNDDKCSQKCDNERGKRTEKDCENKNPPVCPNCPRIRQAPNDQISRLVSEKFSDKDMLLIAGLIFLLMKQGADRKLILALAFVLLS